jgi:hypothetical protein
MTVFSNSFPVDAAHFFAHVDHYSLTKSAVFKILPHPGPWMS